MNSLCAMLLMMMDANPGTSGVHPFERRFWQLGVGRCHAYVFYFGRSLAREAVEVLEKPKNYDMKANFVENQMMFDYIRINDRKLSLDVER
ncbi:MAG: hypothetical protein R2738_04130 [Bacteroides graminisolvens]